MKLFVNTRSKTQDYRYLGSTPEASWLDAYKDNTSFEHPTIIIERNGQSKRLFLSGIPSNRKDRVGTIIRYSFLFDLSNNKQEEFAKSLVGLIAEFIQVISTNDIKNLANKLDKLYSEEQVANIISNRENSDNSQDSIQDNIENWLKKEFSLPELNYGNLDLKCDQCYLENLGQASNKFIPAVYKLLLDNNDIYTSALYLNFIDDNNDVNQSNILTFENNFIILLSQGERGTINKPNATNKMTGDNHAKKPLATPNPTPTVSPKTKAILIIAIILVVIIILFMTSTSQAVA